jgi:hypothetical protein
MRLARDDVASAPDEKIQVAAQDCLLHVLDVEPRVSARRELQLRAAPLGAPPCQLRVADIEVEAPFLDNDHGHLYTTPIPRDPIKSRIPYSA